MELAAPHSPQTPLLRHIKAWELWLFGGCGWITLYSQALGTSPHGKVFGEAESLAFLTLMWSAAYLLRKKTTKPKLRTDERTAEETWLENLTVEQLEQELREHEVLRGGALEKLRVDDRKLHFVIRSVQNGRTIVIRTDLWHTAIDGEAVLESDNNRQRALAHFAMLVSKKEATQQARAMAEPLPIWLLEKEHLHRLALELPHCPPGRSPKAWWHRLKKKTKPDET